MTTVMEYLLHVLQSDGQLISVLSLAEETGMNYSWLNACVHRLAEENPDKVKIRRLNDTQGRPLYVTWEAD